MRTHSRRIWLPATATGLLILLGLFVLDGVAAGVVLFVAFLAAIGTGIYALAGEKVNDGFSGIGGPF